MAVTAPGADGGGPAGPAQGVGMLDREIEEHRGEILRRWIEGVIDDYPEETGKFLRNQSDRFANPVGASLREGLTELLDGVLRGVEADELTSALDRVIRVRAVQEFSPSAAVGFVFDLKDLLREVTKGTGGDAAGSLDAIDDRIERLGLHAFDVYMSCREQMWSIRMQEIRNQSLGIMERMQEWREKRAENPEHAPRS
ncbi:MAG: RsbRD N-terminal domain-containing protein [Acidobacteria bacterium]|nr:RsbRD N-terminal domain-containing protein [Candidatus Sulfomarinibacter sp. MAG AM2]